MNLNEEQRRLVAEWFAAGASLDEIQKRIRAEFDVHLTYLDVRLLVAELPQPVEEDPDEPKVDDGEAAQDAAEVPAPPQSPEDTPPQEAVPLGEVEVTVDALMIPGTMASGEVTFSDGTKGRWYVDQTGRLGLGDLPEGYRPRPEDGAVFQSKLMSALQAKGLC